MNCHEFMGNNGRFTVETRQMTEAFGFSLTDNMDAPHEKMIGSFSVFGLVDNPVKRAIHQKTYYKQFEYKNN